MIRARRTAGSTEGAAPSARAKDLEAFLAASRAAARPGTVERGLGAILDAAISLLGADEGSVMLLDEQAGGLRIVAARGLPADVRRDTVVPPGRGIAGTVAKTGAPLLLPSPLEVTRFEGYVEKSRPIHSAVCVPLRHQDRTVGVLNLNLVRPSDVFDDDDLRAAVLFAEHAAIAIANAETIARSERTTRELETLRAASSRLGRSLRLDDVADAALTEAMAICGSSAGLLVLSGEGQVELARYRGLSRGAVRSVVESVAFGAEVAAGRARTVRSIESDPVFGALAADVGPVGLAVAPIVGGQDAPGGLLAVSLPDADDRTASRVLATYAAEAGLAISNAALHEQVRSKERELATIVEAIASPIVLVDARGCFRAINPAAAETFHLTPEFELGASAAGKLDAALEELLFGPAEGSRDVVLPVGGEPHVWRATVTTSRSGPVAGGRLLVLDDVTAQRELERRKADFLAVIGHELRTPLTVIRGFASTLARRDLRLDDDTRYEAVGSILEQSTRLGQMIEDLLYVSRIENRTPPLHLAWGDVADAAAAAIQPFRERQPGRAFTLRATPTQLLFDRVKVEQVLRHLLDNAVKYSDEDRPVGVRVEDEGDLVRVTVEDKGIGIFSGDIPRLFRVFGQLDGSATRRHGGTGVGLSVCKTLVEAMGGRIWAQSMLGKGSEFAFTVPKSPPASDRA